MKCVLNFIICMLVLNHSGWAMGRKISSSPAESPQAFADSAYWQGQVKFAQSNLQEIYKEIELDSSTLGSLRAKKCGSNQNCYLNECDIHIPSCRNDHVLLFRGEGGFPKVGVSSSVRYQLEDPQYCGKDCSGQRLLDLLNAYMAKRYPDLQPADFVSKAEVLHQDSDHFNGSNASVSLDPFISTTPLPDYAVEFEPGSSGRILVLTVPEEMMNESCPVAFPKPGELILSTKCKDFDSKEPEVDFVLYINPEYILGVTR